MRPALLVSSLLALLVAIGGAGAPSLPAHGLAGSSQGAANAAGLVIADPNGGPPKTVCVRFASASITGKQLLDMADQQVPSIDPVYSGAEFGSQGQAVCALCGEGCPAGDCFCQSRYWNYNVARDGGWVRSGVGIERRTVRHGDVDGWAFGGDGAAPPYITFETICGAVEPSPSPSASTAPPSPSPSPTRSPSPTAAPSRSPAPAGTGAPSPSPTGAAGTPVTSEPAPSETASASASPAPAASAIPTPTVSPSTTPSTDAVAGEEAAAEASGPWGIVAFLIALGGIVGLALRRRARD